MRASLRVVRCYDVEIGGVGVGRFSEAGRWEGMLKLVNGEGQVIVVEEAGDLSSLFSEIVGSPLEVDVVRISASLAVPPVGHVRYVSSDEQAGPA